MGETNNKWRWRRCGRRAVAAMAKNAQSRADVASISSSVAAEAAIQTRVQWSQFVSYKCRPASTIETRSNCPVFIAQHIENCQSCCCQESDCWNKRQVCCTQCACGLCAEHQQKLRWNPFVRDATNLAQEAEKILVSQLQSEEFEKMQRDQLGAPSDSDRTEQEQNERTNIGAELNEEAKKLRQLTNLRLQDREKKFLASDPKNHCVYEFNYGGRMTGQFGSKGSSQVSLHTPKGMYIYENILYVVDSKNKRNTVFSIWSKDYKNARGS
uniref:TNFR-Cys domain-containing protein n=1 Tax=Macrostomum lignano TaxID=282301 RepID=A0A1I8FEN9_9PLAT